VLFGPAITRERLQSNAEYLEDRLGVDFGESDQYFLADATKGDYRDPAQRCKLIGWLSEKADLYEHALREVF
jgi:hypothetical protein